MNRDEKLSPRFLLWKANYFANLPSLLTTGAFDVSPLSAVGHGRALADRG